jgi:hypothetical protein
MKYVTKFMVLVAVMIFAGSFLYAQGDSQDDVHLFQTFFKDTPISPTYYGEGGIAFSDFGQANAFQVLLRGGLPFTPKFEMGVEVSYINVSPDQGDGQSGISDISVSGRYNVLSTDTKVSVGGFLTLPVGEEKIGEGNTNFGAFGALRHPFPSGLVLTGVLGLEFLEAGDNRETSLLLGGGVIYPTSDQLSIVGELNLQTEGDFALLSGGVDYDLTAGNRLRGAIGLGLDDGAPDFMFLGSFLRNF